MNYCSQNCSKIETDLYTNYSFQSMPRNIHDIKSEIVVDQRFDEVIKSLKNIKLPYAPREIDYTPIQDISHGKVVQIEKEQTKKMNYIKGLEITNRDDVAISAYDESIASYDALEGHAVCVSHALVYLCKEDYIPITYVTLRFFTRSEELGKKIGDCAIVTDDASHESMVCIARDKIEFLEKNCVDNSILLVDGPLIAGEGYTTFMPQIKRFCERNILAAFFVKNSDSNMVIDNIKELSRKYNSDMHWSNEILKPGERTSFFEYIDVNNTENAKVFCYMKCYEDTSPVRLEFPKKIFEQFKNSIEDIIDLAYYLLLDQGEKKNPQIRPIAIAEKYARETMKVIDVQREIRKAGLVPTMNENRWGE